MPSNSNELENLSDLVIKLHDDRELMRLASLVGTDAKTPELNLAKYIEKLISSEREAAVK